MGLAIWKFLSGYRWDIKYAKDSRISGVAYWKIQKQGFKIELIYKETKTRGRQFCLQSFQFFEWPLPNNKS